MYVLSEIGTHKKIKRFVLCSSLFTVVYIYICYLWKITAYSCKNNPLFVWSLSTVTDCPFACNVSVTNQAVHG